VRSARRSRSVASSLNRPVRLPAAITSRVAPANQLKLSHLALVAIGLIVLVVALALGGGAIERVLRGDTASVDTSDASSTSLSDQVDGSGDELPGAVTPDPSTDPTDPTESTVDGGPEACAAAELLSASQPLTAVPLTVVSKQCEGAYGVVRLVTVPPTPDIPPQLVWVALRADEAGWHPLASGYVADETTWAVYCVGVQQTVDPSFVTSLCR
jgi:hypothetical protein